MPESTWFENPTENNAAISTRLGFSSQLSFVLWIMLLLGIGGWSLYPRFYDWENPLMEPHPIRQSQTALAIREFARGNATLLDYRSSFNGALWNFVIEFPLYQKIASFGVRLGGSVEVASRATTFLFFCVGLYYFFGIVKWVAGNEAALWGTLLYFLSPFSIMYSRMCLIDPFGVTLALGSVYFAIRDIKKNHIGLALLSALLGVLAALVKPTIWYPYATALFFVYINAGWKKQITRIGFLFLQFVMAVIWIRWTLAVRGLNEAFLGKTNSFWIIGSVESRFLWKAWEPILQRVFRFIWNDWMIPMALLAFLSKSRRWVGGAIFLALFGILGPFNVHRFHDYYLIAEAPFLFFIVGVGAQQLFQLRKWEKLVAISLIALFLGHSLKNISTWVSPIFWDQRSEIRLFQKVAVRTRPQEIIYVESTVESWFLPLYSDRFFIQSYRYDPKSIIPTVFWFKDSEKTFSILDKYQTVWTRDFQGDPILYRVGSEYDEQSVIVSEVLIPGYKTRPLAVGEALICEGRELRLPLKKYIYVPKGSNCNVSLDSKKINQ